MTEIHAKNLDSLEKLNNELKNIKNDDVKFGNVMGRKVTYKKEGDVSKDFKISLNKVMKQTVKLTRRIKGPLSASEKALVVSIKNKVASLNDDALKGDAPASVKGETKLPERPAATTAAKIGRFFANMFSGYNIRMGTVKNTITHDSKEVVSSKAGLREGLKKGTNVEFNTLKSGFVASLTGAKDDAQVKAIVDEFLRSVGEIFDDTEGLFDDTEGLTGKEVKVLNEMTKGLAKKFIPEAKVEAAKAKISSYKVSTLALDTEIGGLIKKRLGELKKATSLEGNKAIKDAIDTFEGDAKGLVEDFRAKVGNLGKFTGSDELEGEITQLNEDIAKAVTDAKAKLFINSSEENQTEINVIDTKGGGEAKVVDDAKVASYDKLKTELGTKIDALIKESIKIEKSTSLDGNKAIKGGINTLEADAKKLFEDFGTEFVNLGTFTGSDDVNNELSPLNEDIAKAVTDAKAKLYKESPGEGGGGADAK